MTIAIPRRPPIWTPPRLRLPASLTALFMAGGLQRNPATGGGKRNQGTGGGRRNVGDPDPCCCLRWIQARRCDNDALADLWEVGDGTTENFPYYFSKDGVAYYFRNGNPTSTTPGTVLNQPFTVLADCPCTKCLACAKCQVTGSTSGYTVTAAGITTSDCYPAFSGATTDWVGVRRSTVATTSGWGEAGSLDKTWTNAGAIYPSCQVVKNYDVPAAGGGFDVGSVRLVQWGAASCAAAWPGGVSFPSSSQISITVNFDAGTVVIGSGGGTWEFFRGTFPAGADCRGTIAVSNSYTGFSYSPGFGSPGVLGYGGTVVISVGV